MNIVNTGEQYRIYGESLRTFDRLPPQTYTVGFHPQMGFWLETHKDLDNNEEKIYGSHNSRAEKILNSFAKTNRNFGVILSGHKGIGKSLLVRILAEKAISNGLPVIIVDSPINGIANFLASIDQEIMVVFDEFEKVFAEDSDGDPQVQLLSLFDGIDGGKKLFVITCNETKSLNEYFVNRPGRFHYHFEITFPTGDEIKEYMTDKIGEGFDEEVEKIAKLGSVVNLTYDCLRAIAFELNQGYSLEDTLRDLNMNHEDNTYFDVIAHFTNGTAMTAYYQKVPVYGDTIYTLLFRNGSNCYYARIKPKDIVRLDNVLYIPGEKVTFWGDWENYDDQFQDEEAQKRRDEDKKNLILQNLVLNKVMQSDVNKYSV